MDKTKFKKKLHALRAACTEQLWKDMTLSVIVAPEQLESWLRGESFPPEDERAGYLRHIALRVAELQKQAA